jgi:branched-chain amino acid transport system ATP-binding protein
MPPEADALLQASRIDAGYGTMQVLWGVDLDVRPGETVLLLGANGAGKTTFLKSLVGLVAVRHGSIRLGHADITKMRSSARMRLGMTYMSELAVFPDLTIEENIRIGAQALGHPDPGSRLDELYGLFPALRDKRRDAASSLSGGQRKMLGIAKALAAEPKLLVMDEPSAGLSPLFVKEVIRILANLRGRGLAGAGRLGTGGRRRAGGRAAAPRRVRRHRPHQHDRIRLFRHRHQPALRHAEGGLESQRRSRARRLVVGCGGLGPRRHGSWRARHRYWRLLPDSGRV